jgi:hypothetical protein
MKGLRRFLPTVPICFSLRATDREEREVVTFIFPLLTTENGLFLPYGSPVNTRFWNHNLNQR